RRAPYYVSVSLRGLLLWCRQGADNGNRRHGVAKLAKRTVDALMPREKAYVAYDSELHGFGVRASGHKSFIVEYRPHGGGRGVATRRVTLGALGALTPDQARRAAQEALARIRLGE